ncbi:MAG: hypothetical protein ICV67_03880 [Thermoleophilia bacterium]|nr:hypothetical protein [Thermoleophilia bacterium]
MRLAPGDEIGWEAHHDPDQFLRVERTAGRRSSAEGTSGSTRRTRSRTTGR